MTEKVTLTERINSIGFETLTEEEFSFLKERALKSVRKNSGTSKRGLTKTQKENLTHKTQIVALLKEAGKMTATQIGEHFGWKGSQKATALLIQLEKEGLVERQTEGKVALFSATAVTEEVVESEEEEATE